MIVQKLNKQEGDELGLAMRYFKVIAAITGVHLTEKEVQLLSFTALKGNISSGGARQEFVEAFNTSKATLENIKHGLVKKGFIVKQDSKYKVNPAFASEFTGIVLQININIKPSAEPKEGENTDTQTA
jgi:hypothetical protein